MRKWQDYNFVVAQDNTTKYPVLSICAVVGLLLLAPFTTSWLALVAFAICLYRVIRYDAQVFATDYCLLIPLTALMKLSNGTPLSIYLCLIAAIWYLIRDGLRVNATLVLLIVLMNYLLTRMQMDINGFVLLFGQLAVMIVLLPRQDHHSATRALKAFCISLIFSSVYAYTFRNVSWLADITGANSTPMYGTNLRRFCGLNSDPNYYSTVLVIGISVLMKLKDSKAVRSWVFWCAIGIIAVFGVLTYSKSFLLMFIFMVGIYMLWQFLNRKLIKGAIFTILAIVALVLVLSLENSPVAVVLDRLTSAQSLSELTTSRSDIFMLYWKEIAKSWQLFFFGKGIAAEALYRDPHNLYLETIYYVGTIGFGLIVALYIGALRSASRAITQISKQNVIAKYSPLVILLVTYMALQGVFMQIFHAELLLVALTFMVAPQKMERTGDE